jgi:hypothetical protein
LTAFVDAALVVRFGAVPLVVGRLMLSAASVIPAKAAIPTVPPYPSTICVPRSVSGPV